MPHKNAPTVFHFQEVSMEMHKTKCDLEPALSNLFSFTHAPRLGLRPRHHGHFFLEGKGTKGTEE